MYHIEEKCMKYQDLYEALPFLKETDRKRQERFEEYFGNAPLWLLNAFQVEELDKETVIVQEDEPVEAIYFIGKGIITAVDYRIYGRTYNFMRFDKLFAIGGMEFLTDSPVYRTTLQTITKCTVVKLPYAEFEKWMHSDIRAVKLEAKWTMEHLLEEARNSRLFLFLQGPDRLALLFVERYEHSNRNGLLQMRDSRQDLADETGLSIKSISRGVQEFMKNDMLVKEGSRILINEQQYKKLKKIVNEKIVRNKDEKIEEE